MGILLLQIKVIERLAYKKISPGDANVRQGRFQNPGTRRRGLGDDFRDTEMGHKDRAVDDDHPVEEKPVNRGLTETKEQGHHDDVKGREEKSQKPRAVEQKRSRVKLVGDHKIVDSVMEHQS